MRPFRSALAVAILLVGACGDDDQAAPGDTDTPTSGDTSTTVAALTGDPVRLVSIIDASPARSYREMRAAIQAVADEVNADGGLGGRPLEIEVCETDLDPNTTAQCARDAAADPSVIAAVGNFTNFGEGANQILADAGIASIGNIPVTLADYSCPVCFPTNGGSLAGVVGQATLVSDVLEGDTVNLLITDVPAAAQLQGLVTAVLGGRGGTTELDRVSAIATNAADLSAPAATLDGNGADGIMIAVAREHGLNFINTARSQGVATPLVVTALTIGPDDLDSLGDAADGLYVTSLYRHSGPVNDEFNSQVEAVDPDATRNDFALTSWLAARLFVDVAADLPDITRESVLEAMNGLSGYETGVTPTLDFTTPSEVLGGALPRLFNTAVTYNQVTNGRLEPLLGGDFFDLFVAPAAA